MKNTKNIEAFTLVELIIVITILSILATISFVSFQGYTRDARDSSRLGSIASIQKGLEMIQVKSGTYPEPEKITRIEASGSLIGKQGEIREQVSSIIKMSQTPLDPLDHFPYVYLVNTNNRKYQLLSYMEGSKPLAMITQTYAADTNERQPRVFGDSLGILLNEDNSPVSGTGIDILKTNTTYKAMIDNTQSGTVSGTGSSLGMIVSYFKKDYKSCKEISDNFGFSGSTGRDGVYMINPDGNGSFQAYCDMTTDGGGWTILIDYIMGNAPQCGHTAGNCPPHLVNKNSVLVDVGSINSNNYSIWSKKKLLYNGEIIMKLKNTGEYVLGNNKTKLAKWYYDKQIGQSTYGNDLDMFYSFGWQWGSPTSGVGGMYFSLYEPNRISWCNSNGALSFGWVGYDSRGCEHSPSNVWNWGMNDMGISDSFYRGNVLFGVR